MAKEVSFWEVTHPEHEPVCVESPDRLHAVVGAARAWGVTMWTSVVSDCVAEKIAPDSGKETAPAAEQEKKSRKKRKGKQC